MLVGSIPLFAAWLASTAGISAVGTPPPKPDPVMEEANAALARANDPKAIRTVELKALLASPLGFVSTSEVAYADLTGDGKEEVVVPLASGGTAGDVAIVVFGYDPDGILRPLLLHQGPTGHLLFKLEKGKLIITEPIYGPNDPNCCPGGFTHMTYGWNGHALVLQGKRAEKVKK